MNTKFKIGDIVNIIFDKKSQYYSSYFTMFKTMGFKYPKLENFFQFFSYNQYIQNTEFKVFAIDIHEDKGTPIIALEDLYGHQALYDAEALVLVENPKMFSKKPEDNDVIPKKEFKYHWEEIKNNINWQKINQVMVLLNWKYLELNRVPTIEELQDTAKKLLKQAYKQESGINSLGFLIQYNKSEDSLHLAFVLADWFS